MHTICSERTDMLHISYGVWKSEEHRGRIIGQDEAKNYILEEKVFSLKILNSVLRKELYNGSCRILKKENEERT